MVSLFLFLGERLFPLIQTMHANLAGKITGMLLEIDNSELLHMLESHESLRSKVLGFHPFHHFLAFHIEKTPLLSTGTGGRSCCCAASPSSKERCHSESR